MEFLSQKNCITTPSSILFAALGLLVGHLEARMEVAITDLGARQRHGGC